MGDVRIDQLQLMQRCGFDQAVLAPGESLDHAQRLLALFPEGFYQDGPIPRAA